MSDTEKKPWFSEGKFYEHTIPLSLNESAYTPKSLSVVMGHMWLYQEDEYRTSGPNVILNIHQDGMIFGSVGLTLDEIIQLTQHLHECYASAIKWAEQYRLPTNQEWDDYYVAREEGYNE